MHNVLDVFRASHCSLFITQRRAFESEFEILGGHHFAAKHRFRPIRLKLINIEPRTTNHIFYNILAARYCGTLSRQYLFDPCPLRMTNKNYPHFRQHCIVFYALLFFVTVCFFFFSYIGVSCIEHKTRMFST